MPRTAETASFQFNHTMIRVRDPDISVKFYTEIIGMDLLSKKNMGDFTLYFLAFDQGQNYKDMSEEEKDKARFSREGVLELTHNHGTESDASFAGYASGNSDPGRGFGHIAITVDDVEESCARFEKLGVQFKKRPQDGKMKHIAFILDPDGYWIEVVPSTMKL
ncbi:Glyoxalase/Bleomycin resistance protein/Dihydroxybiphenyl dioxygenase [Lentinula detonsa]|uniref:lactoylglutathione lyase n=1 Tax=Lentinula detonsa TaxID=2804962 RepID=A0A9W8U210_9AGAR|nr:Glyoxalase/Bleomycin resistance protein/Dihydroxybiphenyl dioxygenase [Lentinula detonsa]KAJ3802150.1 Glyoxalase/Bleomycin resistance protein/Dihydroxybiphenyl dioxygenase [Lentinula aff. detonsa]KAJ3983182.1 Glyoxalase/Bleomycin resistance protein/Dihydroxybiphenyl dioxygenase [Lentinula detonsa]